MKVKVLVSFSAMVNGKPVSYAAGDQVDMPKGADWLAAGFVEKIGPVKRARSAATRKPAETATSVSRKTEGTKPKGKK